MKIYAFIVTYNRLELLKRTIQCLKEQSYKITEIIVINNSSTDGTLEWLKKQNNIKVITQDNSGGAGGFHTGIEYCIKAGAEWIWMMDDDVFPRKDCLERLMKYKDISLCMQATRITNDGKRIEWNYSFNLNNVRVTSPKPYWNIISQQDYYEVETGCFEGMLIHASIVKKIGYPLSDFFISGDDILYGKLASKYTKVICIKDAIIDRYANSYDKRYSPMYTYYSTRNIHLLLSKDTKINNGYTLSLKIQYFFYILRIILGVIRRKDCPNKYSICKAYYRGYIDSLKGLKGKTF